VAVPATAFPAPSCTRAGRPHAANTRPRLDRCRAHRIRPDRPHRPRSRPVFGLPLRQLASDPFHPVEGGSCNDYDYTCGDPVNSHDLDGTEVRGRCTTVEGYGGVGGSVTACDLRDDRGNSTQTVSVGGGVGVALSGSTGAYFSNAPTVYDVLGWSQCQSGSYGPVSGQLCFFHAGPNRASYFSVYGGLGPGLPGGSISAVRTYRPNRAGRAIIRRFTRSPPKCSWGGSAGGGGGSWGGLCRFESY
jgi:hypothetical protein